MFCLPKTAWPPTLRDKTGAPMMDCKKALVESKGNLDDAIAWLRKRGVSVAMKKATRATLEGAVESYIHAGGKIGVLVQIASPAVTAANKETLLGFVKDVAMHSAAAAPAFVSRDQVPTDVLDREKDVYRAKAKESGKPDAIIEKIIDGQINKYYADKSDRSHVVL